MPLYRFSVSVFLIKHFFYRISENEKVIRGDVNNDRNLQEVTESCRSLSYYDGRTIKTLIPQVSVIVVKVTTRVPQI